VIGRHELRVMSVHARIATSTELQYRSNFWVYLFNTVMTLGISLVSIGLVFRHVDEIGGWSRDDLFVVLGVFFLLGSIVNGIVHASLATLVTDIRTGDFDFRLLRPVDTQFVAVVQSPDPWRALDVVVGIGVIAVGLAHGGLEDAPGGAAGAIGAALGLFACSVVIVTAFWALLASLTFWTIQGEGILWALDDMYDDLRWPITIFPGGLRLALSTVFPAGLAVTVPAQALTGRLDTTAVLSCVALAGVFCVASRALWQHAVRRYEGASG
jgi:ABC-2 type transport system permease protein